MRTPPNTSLLDIAKALGTDVLPPGPAPAGGGLTVSPDGPPAPLRYFTWAYDGDAAGVVYAAAYAAIATPVRALRSSNSMGSPGDLIDRTAQNTYTNSEFGAWAALDLGVGFPLNPTRYSLRNRSDGPGNIIRSWNLQGSTDVGEWSVAGINAATWTDLDRRTNDASLTFSDQWGHWDVTAQPNAYRYIRIIMTGPESSGNWYLTIDEIELYGVVTLAPNLPSGATGWLTDGTHYVPYY